METRHTKKLFKTNNLVKKMASLNSFKFLSNRVEKVLDFLSKLFPDGHSYIQINTASRALTSILLLISYFVEKKMGYLNVMKDIFELQPIFLRYHMIWDVKKSLITLV